MLLLVRKDLLQAWRTFRLPALILTGVFFALLDPLTAKFMPQILGSLAMSLKAGGNDPGNGPRRRCSASMAT